MIYKPGILFHSKQKAWQSYMLWFSFILGLNFTFFDSFFKVIYGDKFEPKENKISTRDESELQLTSILSLGVPSDTSHLHALYI